MNCVLKVSLEMLAVHIVVPGTAWFLFLGIT